MSLVAEEEKWARASARRGPLCGRQLSRRSDKGDADPTLKAGFSYRFLFVDGGAIRELQRNIFLFGCGCGILTLSILSGTRDKNLLFSGLRVVLERLSF